MHYRYYIDEYGEHIVISKENLLFFVMMIIVCLFAIVILLFGCHNKFSNKNYKMVESLHADNYLAQPIHGNEKN